MTTTGSSGKFRRPIRDCPKGTADGAGNETRVGREVFVDLNVDQSRAIGATDETGKFLR